MYRLISSRPFPYVNDRVRSAGILG
ncbi:hypothetical protein FRAHR75_1330006 [Frankia sp. Hr75.2]|nr:hypothetical protein FRAHR75_1330006 [Frankia sp. Hr75.2]SQD98160.1 hypothetical protein FMEAI12_4540021 [Parafrankia sp. Ea1.12]